MSNSILEKETKFFQENKRAFLSKYKNRYIIIKDCTVKGDFKTLPEAMTFALSKYELGSFIVEHCSQFTQEPQTFHSRVIFRT